MRFIVQSSRRINPHAACSPYSKGPASTVPDSHPFSCLCCSFSHSSPPEAYQAQRPQVSDVPQLTVIASKSIIVNTAEPIERVAVTTTDIADALVISPQQVMINGKAPGIVSLVLWDRTGKSTSYDLVVEIDLSLLQRQLEEQFPTENISVTSAKGALVLSGSASEPRVAEKAIEIAGSFSPKVINLLQLPPPPDTEQILLQVKFADVDRAAVQQLGINILSTGATNTLGSISTQQFGSGLSSVNLSTVSPSPGPGFYHAADSFRRAQRLSISV